MFVFVLFVCACVFLVAVRRKWVMNWFNPNSSVVVLFM